MIKAKLRSSRGATLVFALVALAVAVIVSAVVIYAAQSNAGRIRSAQAAEQAQLTLNSAASAIREQFAGDHIELVNTKVVRTTSISTEPQTQSETVQVSYSNSDGKGHETALASGTYTPAGGLSLDPSLPLLRGKLLRWVIATMSETVLTQNECTYRCVIKANGPEGALEDVNVAIRMEPGATMDLATPDERESHDAEKYYLTVVFSLDSSPSETITMTFMASVSESTKSSLVAKSSYPAVNSKGESITVSYTDVKTEKKLNLSWAQSNIVVNVVEMNGGTA